ncbi:hypothetical protein K493DRAFT_351351 [Basidiobolus meristosporus CBS 931.73]|uniref:Uncharacterized protein n=1 Tax=Basidiobolus meristosporus CBS 931.73 TaxID=1314790 RepID=A0A1Y1YCF3_9FUNG|nr:hypothetical protein K493DRAFT_351351 [Basidiobolus meristosporus CBS 931.73]|eukprot:ORX95721.1 hypothetical protein K493DRAFT_351351 [Basidiobolus meristosporus CBS 931.73]
MSRKRRAIQKRPSYGGDTVDTGGGGADTGDEDATVATVVMEVDGDMDATGDMEGRQIVVVKEKEDQYGIDNHFSIVLMLLNSGSVNVEQVVKKFSSNKEEDAQNIRHYIDGILGQMSRNAFDWTLSDKQEADQGVEEEEDTGDEDATVATVVMEVGGDMDATGDMEGTVDATGVAE